jgi:dihydrodipicolinate synthase/N-acetylneuraminate lyase
MSRTTIRDAERATLVPALRPRRVIEGISAVLLPFTASGQPDWAGFERLLDRTWTAGLTPAVNMDTGYVNLLQPVERQRVLDMTGELAAGRRFVAGAFIEDDPRQPADAYQDAVARIRARGGTPILFQCTALASRPEADVLAVYRQVAAAGGPLLAFELGTMFAPFGRIYSTDFFRALLDIEAFTGMKHSSLDRLLEWDRLAARDRHRPEFRLYTGNDLAIDMVFYGSDYLLGLSAFAVDAFAARDRAWASGDVRAFMINDLLQYLGQLAFRAPVPAYKHSAAQFLTLRGLIDCDEPHPANPRRPASDLAVLGDIARRLDVELTRGAA